MFPKRSTTSTFFGLALLLLGTASCTVYAPMQPTMPLITAVHQAEATASIQPNGRVEATAAYSPTPHLLLSAGGTVCPKIGNDNFLVTRQYELGAGGYLPLGSSWLLNGLGGFGQAVSTHGEEEGVYYGRPVYREHHANYSKLFAQVGAAKIMGADCIGFTYRLTHVRFSTLTDTELGKLPLSQMLRHEALIFIRHRWSSNGHWESIATMGASVNSTANLTEHQVDGTFLQAEHQANQVSYPTLYASLGIIYKPHWGHLITNR